MCSGSESSSFDSDAKHASIHPTQRTAMILHPGEGRFDASSSRGDNTVPSTVNVKETDPNDERFSDEKSDSTRKPKAVLQFALNSLNTEDFPSFVKQRESTLTFPEKVKFSKAALLNACLLFTET